ncbi:MAG TPA: 4-hydroxy-tetrahydrodipicolinate synthase, partial [Flavobacteriales bacterium]|nr:4-hydroxy-tetrahydrodipicolinate synthase [Flavobacteriales bacterium]
VIKAIFKEGNPAGIKAMLQHLNICEDYVRLPLVSASKELKNEIYSLVAELDVTPV